MRIVPEQLDLLQPLLDQEGKKRVDGHGGALGS
jgi:hypothetical protein